MWNTTQFSLGFYPRVQPLQLLFLTAGGLVAHHQESNVWFRDRWQHLNKLLTQPQKPNQKSEQICPPPFLKCVCSGKRNADVENGSTLIWACRRKKVSKKKMPVRQGTRYWRNSSHAIQSKHLQTRLSDMWVFSHSSLPLSSAIEKLSYTLGLGKLAWMLLEWDQSFCGCKLPFFLHTPRTNIANRLQHSFPLSP